MKVTLYTKEGCAECQRVGDMLTHLARTEVFSLHEASSPGGAPAPCVRFDAPGAPFYRAEGMTEGQFLSYLAAARESLDESSTATPTRGGRAGKRTGSLPTAEHEAQHPVRSFVWRHRVGGIITSLSAFIGLSWVAPLTPSWGWGNGFYDAVYSAYRLVCTQTPGRSPELMGLPACLCWRCIAMYAGSLLFGILYTIARDRDLKWMGWLTRPVSLVVMLLYGLPLILDGASHALGLRTDATYAQSADFWVSWGVFSADWWLRIITTLIATVGAVKFLCPRLDKLGFAYEQLHKARKQSDVPLTVAGIAPQT